MSDRGSEHNSPQVPSREDADEGAVAQDPRATEHPVGAEQARKNIEDEPAS